MLKHSFFMWDKHYPRWKKEMRIRLAVILDLFITLVLSYLNLTPDKADGGLEIFLYFHTKSIFFIFVLNVILKIIVSSITGRTLGEMILRVKKMERTWIRTLQAYGLETVFSVLVFVCGTMTESHLIQSFKWIPEVALAGSLFFAYFIGAPLMLIYLIFIQPLLPKFQQVGSLYGGKAAVSSL